MTFPPPCVQLRLQFNEHKLGYEPLASWLEHQCDGTSDCWYDWVSPEERAKAIEQDTVWTVQWHPETVVGFHGLAASSFEALATAMERFK